MKSRTITTHEELQRVASVIEDMGKYLPFVITITSGKKIRSEAQNSRYWAGLNEYLEQINQEVEAIEERGYTNLEARKLIAKELPWEQSLILGATNAEVAHAVLKIICGIPSSTKLGTKAFMQFESTMEQQIYEIVGSIRHVAGRLK